MVARARTLMLPLVVLGLSVALGACGTSDKKSSTGPAGTTAQATGATSGTNIIIKDFVFKPQELSAKVGDTITVKNDDGTTHTVTADKSDPAFDTGHIDGGATKTFKVDKAGTFKFHCDIHNYMTGSISVS